MAFISYIFSLRLRTYLKMSKASSIIPSINGSFMELTLAAGIALLDPKFMIKIQHQGSALMSRAGIYVERAYKDKEDHQLPL